MLKIISGFSIAFSRMKAVCFMLGLLLIHAPSFSQKRGCASVEYHQLQLKKDPSLQERRRNGEAAMQSRIRQQRSNKTEVEYTIPVVVHVLYQKPVENISDAQVMSQIDVLNEDYGRYNADTTNTPMPWKSIASGSTIHFILAQSDVSGKRTSGIIRKKTNKASFSLDEDDAKYAAQGGDDIWDADKYLNIWVVPAISSGSTDNIIGYAQGIYGMKETDGVVIAFNCFGRVGALSEYYNLGRTTTHEVGHWLDLSHTWGDDGGDCSGSDLVDDTPDQADKNEGTPVFPFFDSCSPDYPGVMFMDYMDYTDDEAMNMFTGGQVERMTASLEGFRSRLKVSPGTTTHITENNVFPNPTVGKVFIDVPSLEIKTVKIKVFNLMGAEVQNVYSYIYEGRYTLDLSEQVNGCYFVFVETDKSTYAKKIVLWKH